MDMVAIITTFIQIALVSNDHYQIRARKWSSFGLTNQTGSAGPANAMGGGRVPPPLKLAHAIGIVN